MPKTKHITVEAPSNIAFVKYWGKKGHQHPINPSISMTLKNCVTSCRIDYHESDNFSLNSYQFENKENPDFKDRIEKYLTSILDICPTLKTRALSIKTKNTFPHSAGIASSASAFASIAMAIAEIENANNKTQRASQLARLGSGSAARSIEGPYTLWGLTHNIHNSSDEHAITYNDTHKNFNTVNDTILLIDTAQKSVSSSAGHALMHAHPFKESRIQQANDNLNTILKAMNEGDWEKFGATIENEALTLHAMMMTSNPPAILLAPQTLDALDKIRQFRQDTKQPLYFTIDAGPNIHLIYPQTHAAKIDSFIKTDLAPLCKNGQTITDENGTGAKVIND
ncbi:MAG: diphosphomevalonate decarboxylase [Bdellovibrionales bacterium]